MGSRDNSTTQKIPCPVLCRVGDDAVCRVGVAALCYSYFRYSDRRGSRARPAGTLALARTPGGLGIIVLGLRLNGWSSEGRSECIRILPSRDRRRPVVNGCRRDIGGCLGGG